MEPDAPGVPAVPGIPTFILLDIEGTTTPIAFVHDTLFSYAEGHLDAWIASHHHDPKVRALVDALSAEYRAEAADPTLPPWRRDGSGDEGASAYARWLMARDRKSPALKTLQGWIWEDGYRAGELHGVVYDDVPPAMKRWRAQGIAIAIYSSGSVLAQRRLFESTAHGDLTSMIAAFFDTAVGAKTNPDSYGRVAEALGQAAPAILFVSDVTKELVAARAAGLQTRLSLRPGNAPQPDADSFESVVSFAEILPRASGAEP
jgi:enolase-phosphatase E1